MIRLILFFVLLFLAAVGDIRKRIVPDKVVLLLMGVSLIPPEPAYVAGLMVALPLLFVGIVSGGIGGGDIKLTSACGLVLGLEKAFVGLFFGLLFLLVFHGMNSLVGRIKNKKYVEKREQAYPLVPFLLLGMLLGIQIGG